MSSGRKDLIAPMPERLPEGAAIWRKLARARENLVAGWSAECFRWKRFHFRVLNQRYVVCNSPKSVRHVFLDNHGNYDKKSPQMRRALEPLLGDGLFVSDGPLWESRRAICAPSMHPRLLGEFLPLMIDTTQDLVRRWAAQDREMVDVVPEMAQLTARIIGRTIFGDDTTRDEAAQVVAGFSRYQASVEQVDLANSLGLPFLRLLPGLSRAADMVAARQVHEVIDRIIERQRGRMRTDGQRPTLLSLFLEAGRGSSSCPLSDSAARNEAIVMFMAGHETTANTIAWALYLIAAAPHYGAMLREEVDRVIGDETPNLDHVDALAVTRAVVEETLRLYPPVPILGRQARGSDRIGDYDVKGGDIVLVVPWLLHRHDLYWEMPNAFRPERFLTPAKGPDRFVYIPFSAGPRVCLGQRFGLTESILCLALIARNFELDLAPGQEVTVTGRLTLRPSGGLPMRIRSRRPGS